MPLRLLVILLGRLLRLLQSTAVPGVRLLQASGPASQLLPHAHHGPRHNGQLDLRHLWPARVLPPLPPCHHQPLPLSPSSIAAREQRTQRQHSLCSWHAPAVGREAHLTAPPARRVNPTCYVTRGSHHSGLQEPHGFTHATERILLPKRAWDQGRRTHGPDVRDILPATTGLLPFIVHEAHCQQAKQKDGRERMMPTKPHPLP